MSRFSSLGSLLLASMAWSAAARAEPEPCVATGEPWIALVFVGQVWSSVAEEDVVRELRVELARRSLSVCRRSEGPPGVAPRKLITLLSTDGERVSIVASNIENEGYFTGRTIFVGAIPEDARALAVAQAVDEALTSGEDPSPVAPALPARAPAEPTAPEPISNQWFVAAALAPLIQVAPATFAGATHAVVAPGAALRLSLDHTYIAASVGIAVTKVNDLGLVGSQIHGLRSPADLSLGLRLSRGAAHGIFDLGLLAALSNYEDAASDHAHSVVDFGARAGLRLGWGQHAMPWIGASIEAVSRSHSLRFSPSGEFARTPRVWLGLALGGEVRWP